MGYALCVGTDHARYRFALAASPTPKDCVRSAVATPAEFVNANLCLLETRTQTWWFPKFLVIQFIYIKGDFVETVKKCTFLCYDSAKSRTTLNQTISQDRNILLCLRVKGKEAQVNWTMEQEGKISRMTLLEMFQIHKLCILPFQLLNQMKTI